MKKLLVFLLPLIAVGLVIAVYFTWFAPTTFELPYGVYAGLAAAPDSMKHACEVAEVRTYIAWTESHKREIEGFMQRLAVADDSEALSLVEDIQAVQQLAIDYRPPERAAQYHQNIIQIEGLLIDYMVAAFSDQSFPNSVSGNTRLILDSLTVTSDSLSEIQRSLREDLYSFAGLSEPE
jgi:hypothetical protein